MIVAETPATGAGEANKQLARPKLGVAGTYPTLLRKIQADVFVYSSGNLPLTSFADRPSLTSWASIEISFRACVMNSVAARSMLKARPHG